jgi:hypothetical protein
MQLAEAWHAFRADGTTILAADQLRRHGRYSSELVHFGR